MRTLFAVIVSFASPASVTVHGPVPEMTVTGCPSRIAPTMRLGGLVLTETVVLSKLPAAGAEVTVTSSRGKMMPNPGMFSPGRTGFALQ